MSAFTANGVESPGAECSVCHCSVDVLGLHWSRWSEFAQQDELNCLGCREEGDIEGDWRLENADNHKDAEELLR